MKKNKSDFISAASHATVTTGEVIKTLRDLKGWTQKDLANRCGISVTNLSLLENDRIDIGKRRAEQLAKAFKIPSGAFIKRHRFILIYELIFRAHHG